MTYNEKYFKIKKGIAFDDGSVLTSTNALIGGTSIYARDALPVGSTGTIITISDSGADTNSPAGNYAPAYWDADTSEWLYVANSNSVTIAPGPGVLIAIYTASSVSGSVWNDVSGYDNHATIVGSPSVISTTSNGASETFDVIEGSDTDSIIFPTGILNQAGYTLFHVARRVSGDGRIVTGAPYEPVNWLSGHWTSCAGVAYHSGWMTDQTDHYGNNWLISADQNQFYRPNGNVSLSASSGGSGDIPADICVNNISNEPTTIWQIAEVRVYNYEMTLEEISAVEVELAATYGITLDV